jgi:hypothetical protein
VAKRGRPFKPIDERLSEYVHIRLTIEEMDQLVVEASFVGKSLSGYMRERLGLAVRGTWCEKKHARFIKAQ